MSFYLIPAVSYQTQQKLKNHVHDQKAQGGRRSRQLLLPHSIFSNDSKQDSVTPRSSHRRSSKQESTISSNVSTISTDSLTKAMEDLDTTSIFSSSKNSRHNRKSSVFNYDLNAEINEVLKYAKDTKRKRKGKSHSPASSINSIPNNSSTPDVEVNFKDVRYEPIHSEDNEEEEEEAQLTRTYSNVSSIFSCNPKLQDKSKSSPASTISANSNYFASESPKANTYAARLKKKFSWSKNTILQVLTLYDPNDDFITLIWHN